MMGARRTAMVSLAMMALLAVWPNPAHPDTTRDIKVTKIDGKAPADFVADRIGKSWAVVIGIDEYEKVPKLRYAVADAKGVGSALEARGFQVTGLYNEQATRRNILGELGDRLVDRVGENDLVLIFFAGHGDTKTAKGGKTMGYLLPVEGAQTALSETAFSMTTIRDLADALPAKHVLFVIDVCYGGIAGTQGRAIPPMTESYLREITREKGRQLITAGGPNQQALEGPEWGHSLFTYYLLEGLEKGLADLNEDGIIPASELYAYLDARVYGAAGLKGHTQRPQKWNLTTETGEFVFFTSATGKAGRGGLAPPSAVVPVPGVPSAALTQKQQELAVLEEEARRAEEETKQTELDRQIAEKRRQIDEQKKKKLEVASLPSYNAPKQTGRELTGKDGAPMVLVPEGDFLYGDNNERLSLPAFYMDKYEVTTRLYAGFLESTGHTKPKYWEDVRPASDGELPVVGVTWTDADDYCRHYDKRLPTEQEWEKAARGMDGRKYPWGNEQPRPDLGNYGQGFCGPFCNVYEEKLKSVNAFIGGQSPYGIFNMAGNVWEMTSSDKPGAQKVIRGGSWKVVMIGVRSADGFHVPINDRFENIGFRCAQDAR